MWIESHQSLLTHRKTIRFAKALGVKKVTALGHLHAMWWWCLDNAASGFVSQQDYDGLCEGSLWDDESDAFIQALVASGFGDWATDGLDIHDWPDYAGKLLERRAVDRERMREQRANAKGTFTERSPNVRLTKEERSSDVLSNRTLPDLTGPDTTKPKNEQPTAACAADLFDEFAARIESPGANAGAVLAEAVTNQYGLDCRDYGRLGRLAKDHGAPAVLDRIFGLTATWSGKGNPVNYIIAAMNGSAKDRANGNGHSAEKIPPNHHEIEPPDMSHAEPVHNEPLNSVAADLEEAESAEDRALVREHEYRLRLDTHYRVWWDESESYLMMGQEAPRPKPSWPTYLPRLGELVESKVG